jgi:hypothetical protein
MERGVLAAARDEGVGVVWCRCCVRGGRRRDAWKRRDGKDGLFDVGTGAAEGEKPVCVLGFVGGGCGWACGGGGEGRRFDGWREEGGRASEEQRSTNDIPGLVGVMRLHAAGESSREASGGFCVEPGMVSGVCGGWAKRREAPTSRLSTC